MQAPTLAIAVVSISALLPCTTLAQDSANSQLRLVEDRCNRILTSPGSTVRDLVFESAYLRQATCRCVSARHPQVAVGLETAGSAANALALKVVLTCLAESLDAQPDAISQTLVDDFVPVLLGPMPIGLIERARAVVDARCKPPDYPAFSRRTEAVGTTLIEYKVDADGKVQDSRIIKSAGTTPAHKLLDSAAQFSFMHCTFVPARTKDGPVMSTPRISYVWRLID